MDRTRSDEVLGQGKFLRLVRRNGWEFVERTRPVRAAFIFDRLAEPATLGHQPMVLVLPRG